MNIGIAMKTGDDLNYGRIMNTAWCSFQLSVTHALLVTCRRQRYLGTLFVSPDVSPIVVTDCQNFPCLLRVTIVSCF